MSDQLERIEQFLLQHNIKAVTEPTENTSGTYSGPAFLTTISPGVGIAGFLYTYGGVYETERSNAFALYMVWDDLPKFVGLDSYKRWDLEHQGYYRQLGEKSARAYYREGKKNEKELRIALGEELFEEFYNLGR